MEIDTDLSSDMEQFLLDAAVANVRKRVTETPLNDTGFCLTCGEPVTDMRRWCDAECRDLSEDA